MAEEKTKFVLRMTPEEQDLVREWSDKSGCRSQNEFIRQAIRFYCSYLSAENGGEYLSAALTKMMREPLKEMENRMARLLFKLSVEDSIMARLLAAVVEVNKETQRKLRAECVKDVKDTHGSIPLWEAMERERMAPLLRSEGAEIDDDW